MRAARARRRRGAARRRARRRRHRGRAARAGTIRPPTGTRRSRRCCARPGTTRSRSTRSLAWLDRVAAAAPLLQPARHRARQRAQALPARARRARRAGRADHARRARRDAATLVGARRAASSSSPRSAPARSARACSRPAIPRRAAHLATLTARRRRARPAVRRLGRELRRALAGLDRRRAVARDPQVAAVRRATPSASTARSRSPTTSAPSPTPRSRRSPIGSCTAASTSRATPRGRPMVMELELVEPSLFFARGPGSADRFVAGLRDGSATRDAVAGARLRPPPRPVLARLLRADDTRAGQLRAARRRARHVRRRRHALVLRFHARSGDDGGPMCRFSLELDGKPMHSTTARATRPSIASRSAGSSSRRSRAARRSAIARPTRPRSPCSPGSRRSASATTSIAPTPSSTQRCAPIACRRSRSTASSRTSTAGHSGFAGTASGAGRCSGGTAVPMFDFSDRDDGSWRHGGDFPDDELAALIDAAAAQAETAAARLRTPRAQMLARDVVAGDLAVAPVLADWLRESGCDHASLIDALVDPGERRRSRGRPARRRIGFGADASTTHDPMALRLYVRVDRSTRPRRAKRSSVPGSAAAPSRIRLARHRPWRPRHRRGAGRRGRARRRRDDRRRVLVARRHVAHGPPLMSARCRDLRAPAVRSRPTAARARRRA